tara:strand:+ start:325 stop:675 length:351 start_codon:yes stop_codon:yes gene_type:complete
MSSLFKMVDFNNTSIRLQDKLSKLINHMINVPLWFCYLSIFIVIIIQFICPLIIIFSSYDSNYNNYAKYSGIILIIFTILATLLFHVPPTGPDYYAFMSNVTTIGGLGLLVYTLSK